MATSSTPATPTGDILSDDLINEILIRLPAKSLLRCRSVCKTWFSLISNPSFVKSHVRRATTISEADGTFIVGDINDTMSLFCLDSSQYVSLLRLPWERCDYSRVAGIYNGIICSIVVNFVNFFADESWQNPDMYFWNPATKQSKLIPPNKVRYNISKVNIEFGFDPISNDFKVVRILYVEEDSHWCAEVYSLNMNVWRKLDQADNCCGFGSSVCINGLLCYVSYFGMTVFDLHKEMFITGIRVPVLFINANIIEVKGSVAVAGFFDNELYHGKINLWTLDDEACLRGGCGVEASWTLMLSIDLHVSVKKVHGYLNNGDLLVRDEEDYCFSYNSITKEVKHFPYSVNFVYKYAESLFLLQ